MATFDPDAIGPVIADLLRDRPLLPLARPTPIAALKNRLARLQPNDLFPERRYDGEMAGACLAGLWLAYGFLDESHRISQEIQSPTGSYWHGLMHRLEPDFENSKYWFRRVGRHPLFEALQQDVAKLATVSRIDDTAALLIAQPPWDPFGFIDLCQTCIERGSSAELLCRKVQHREWELLFEFSCRHALGKDST